MPIIFMDYTNSPFRLEAARFHFPWFPFRFNGQEIVVWDENNRYYHINFNEYHQLVCVSTQKGIYKSPNLEKHPYYML